ncbi:MAG: NAD(P)-dependent oxidoreductase [Burkholderiaceae bacterium]
MSHRPTSIACIGAGVLGAAIIRRLLACGHDVRVWNRDPRKLEPLCALGAKQADSPGQAAAQAAFVITCVSDGAALEQVVFGQGGIAAAGDADKVLIDMSTCSASQTRAMAARLRGQCAMPWLDAPISGGAPAALAGRMAIMVGGEQSVFERAQPLWDCLARKATLMGASGAGQATKMINQVLVAGGLCLLAEAAGLAARAGIDAARIPEALAGGRADSTQLQEMFPKMVGNEFSITGRIGLMLKDLELIHDMARDHGATMPMTASVTELYRWMIAAGFAERDNSELVRYFRAEQR